jgi:hypothetical protein
MKGPFQSLLPGLFYWDHFRQHLFFTMKMDINHAMYQRVFTSKILIRGLVALSIVPSEMLARWGLRGPTPLGKGAGGGPLASPPPTPGRVGSA